MRLYFQQVSWFVPVFRPSMSLDAPANDCSLRIFGLSVSDVLDHGSGAGGALDVVELWSGSGAVVQAALAAGLTAAPFDKNRIAGVTDSGDPQRTEDILLEDGFRNAVALVLRVRPGGLVWMAPVCSSWIFLNLKNTQRTKPSGPKFSGNTKYVPVRDGNLMAQIAAFLFLVAVSRGVHAVIENPAGSMMFSYGPFAAACANWRDMYWAVLPRCRFSTERLGTRIGKKFKLMGSHPWVRQLACKCACPGGRHTPLHTTERKKGKLHVTGVKQQLVASATYPPKLGDAIVAAWRGLATRSCSGRKAKGWAHMEDEDAPQNAPSRSAAQRAARAWCAPSLDDVAASPPVSQGRSWQTLDVDGSTDVYPRPAQKWCNPDVDE